MKDQAQFFLLDIEFEGWIQRPNRSIPLPRVGCFLFFASWYKYSLDLQKFLITMMSVSQNIICSAAELSHTCSISAPDGWVHNKFSSWSLDWKSHIRIDFLQVLFYEVLHPSEFLVISQPEKNCLNSYHVLPLPTHARHQLVFHYKL